MAARSKPENAILCQPMFVTATESSKSLHESVSACGANYGFTNFCTRWLATSAT